MALDGSSWFLLVFVFVMGVLTVRERFAQRREFVRSLRGHDAVRIGGIGPLWASAGQFCQARRRVTSDLLPPRLEVREGTKVIAGEGGDARELRQQASDAGRDRDRKLACLGHQAKVGVEDHHRLFCRRSFWGL